MEKVTRIGVSLEPDLLVDFDKLIEAKGYSTRSEAIRDLIRNALVEDLWKDEDAEVVGTITLVYEHEKGGVREKLMEIQHAHHSDISSSMHIHLNIDQCPEVLVVGGRAREVKALSDELCSVRGVLHGRLAMTSGSLGSRVHHH